MAGKEAKAALLETRLSEYTEVTGQRLLALSLELDNTKNSLTLAMQNYKNEKFERSTLNHAYQQSLRMMESKNEEEKRLQVRISLLEGDVDAEKENYRKLEVGLLKLMAEYARIQETLADTMQQQTRLIHDKTQYAHPMLLEDIAERVRIAQDKLTGKAKELEQYKVQVGRERAREKNEWERGANQHKREYTMLKTELERRIEYLERENSYEKQRCGELMTQRKELEEQVAEFKRKSYNKNTSEREELYRFMLEEKKKEVEKMLT